MRFRKTLVIVCVLSALLLSGLTAAASASGRTVVSVKCGSGTGLIGLELEHRFENGFAVSAEGGGLYLEDKGDKIWLFQGALSGRYYFVRGDMNPFVGLGAVAAGVGTKLGKFEGNAVAPGVIAIAGLEIMFKRVRLAGEIGYTALFLDNKKLGALTYGASLGYTF
jgi:hypothetical protein